MHDLSKLLAGLSETQRKHLAQRLAHEGKEIRSSEPSVAAAAATAGSAMTGEQPRTAPVRSPAAKGMDFSLLFFSGDGATDSGNKYRLLLESAKFADQHDFAAIWTPERHFQAFGGLYPNPAVLSAALSTMTQRIQIRAGSVVAPLHHPIRIAEEWAVVDNLSGGRVELSFAVGYHPGDFLLAPDSYKDRREITYRHIEIIRRLWAGEAVNFTGVDGEVQSIGILPRPLQRTLPIWLTSSSSAGTWVKAGELGANILTGLPPIGPDPFETLAQRIKLFRQARAEHGHDPHAGKVAVMLHTYLHEDMNLLREQVRLPLSGYLRTFMAQGERLTTKGTDPGIASSRKEDKDTLVAFAFNQLLDHRSLLGTPAKCAEVIERLQTLGVDEIACFIDFGLELDAVLESLTRLNELTRRYQPALAEVKTVSGDGNRD